MSAPQQPGFVPFGWALGQPHATALVVVGAEVPEAFASFQPMRRVYIEAEAAADDVAAPVQQQATAIEPGSPEHLFLLGVPWHLNLLQHADAEHVQAYGRAVWAAAIEHAKRAAPAEDAQAKPCGRVTAEADRRGRRWHFTPNREAWEQLKRQPWDDFVHFDVYLAACTQPATPAQQAAVTVPAPGSPEASAMIDSVLAEYQWPANPKNAARAGYEAARRMLAATPPAAAQAATVPRLGYWDLTDAERGATPRAAPQAPESWEHLKPYGYAPGDYISRCSACGGTFVLDKRATACKRCAEIQHARSLAAPCDVPPAGWQCTRAKGHEGPCAAIPTAPQAVPMTDADIRRAWAEVSLHPHVDARFVEGVQCAERHHGISDDAAEDKAHG